MKQSAKQYNLDKIYANESSLRRYIRLTVGENAGLWDLFWHEMILGVSGGLPGIIGLGLRNKLYSLLFKGFNKRAYLGRNVLLRCPRQIHLSPGVILDDYSQLIATSRQSKAITLGENTFVRSYAMINAGPPEGFVHIGQGCRIGQGALLYGNGGLTIGENVMIAGQSSIIASSHNFGDQDIPITNQGISTKGIVIKNNVWIGTGVRILDGVTIGEGAIIGANAVVNRDVAAGDIVGGIPARPLKSSKLRIRKNHK
ncbi:MAG: hypothetical protein ACC651_03415 [Candidatus Scalindua sp.]